MEIKFKKLNPNAVINNYAHKGDAGIDLTAVTKRETDKYIEYGTGIAIEIPEGYAGFVFPRSSNSKKDLLLCNSVGLIDSNYRGEILVRFSRTVSIEKFKVEKISRDTDRSFTQEIYNSTFDSYDIGDRIAQLVILPYPQIEMIEVENISD